MSKGCILVTGGAGYIGSHTLVELLHDGYTAVVVDNLDNSSEKSLKVVEDLTGHAITFYQVDLLDVHALRQVFVEHQFSAVIHFAGLKAVGESMQKPFWYYQNNLVGTINLIQCMNEFEVKNIVFSSSCTVYGNSEYLPIDEHHPTGKCTNPYGRTKYFIEQIFKDICQAEKDWNVVLLRYFNPVGAHPSGRLGEDPNGIPNQLMPYVAQTAVSRRQKLSVFGADYNTKDGTGVRDYIHVVDLAKGHLKAIDKTQDGCGLKVYNLGTGTGYSVMEMITAFQKASGRKIPYEVVSRRPGDAAEIIADPTLAQTELGWRCKLGLEDMCQDLWRWQSKNPDGYGIGRTDSKTTPEVPSADGETGSTHRSTNYIQCHKNGEIQNGGLQNRTVQAKNPIAATRNGENYVEKDETDVSTNGRDEIMVTQYTNGHVNGFLQNGCDKLCEHKLQEPQVMKNGHTMALNGDDQVTQQKYTENNNNAVTVVQ